MIWHVALTDLCFLVLIVILMKQNTRNPRIFEWLFWLFCYVSIELLFHVPMEMAAAKLIGYLA